MRSDYCACSEEFGEESLNSTNSILYIGKEGAQLGNYYDFTVYLPQFADYLRIFDGWFTTILVGKRVRVTFGDISPIGFTGDSMSRESTSLNLFCAVNDYIPGLYWLRQC